MQAWFGGCRAGSHAAAGDTDSNSKGRAKVQVSAGQPCSPAAPRAAVSAALTRVEEAASPREPRGHAREQRLTGDRPQDTSCTHTQKGTHTQRGPHTASTCRVHRGAHLQTYRHGGLTHRHTNNQEGPKLTQSPDTH